MFRIIYMTTAVLMLCLKSYGSERYNLPQDLMYNGNPVNPLSMPYNHVYTDDMLEPHPVDINNDKLKYDIATNRVILETEEAIIPDHTYMVYDEYKYIATYKDKHIVETLHYEDNATGRFASLGLVKRWGDYIIGVGLLSWGDRAFGGVVKIDWLKDNILQYRVAQSWCELCNFAPEGLGNQDIDLYSLYKLPCLPNKVVFWEIIQADLDYEVAISQSILEVSGKPYLDGADDVKRKTIGIEFASQLSYYGTIPHYPLGDKEKCFHDLAMQLMEAGHAELNMAESHQFTIEVAECLQKL